MATKAKQDGADKLRTAIRDVPDFPKPGIIFKDITPILSDAALALARVLALPTFSVAGMTLLKRMALVIDEGVIAKVFYPVFPPDKNAEEVIAWLAMPR